MVHSQAMLKSLLAAAVGMAGQLEGALIGLIEAEDTLEPGTLIANVTECQYTGYARSPAVAWLTPYNTPEGHAEVHATPVQFKPTDGVTQSTAKQVILINAAGTAILSSYRPDEPLLFVNEESVHVVGFPFRLTQPGDSLGNVTP